MAIFAQHNRQYMDRKEIEIMAPAGNFECLAAAIEGGADSVYFGVGRLNMRSHSANNFCPEDLPEITSVKTDWYVVLAADGWVMDDEGNLLYGRNS